METILKDIWKAICDYAGISFLYAVGAIVVWFLLDRLLNKRHSGFCVVWIFRLAFLTYIFFVLNLTILNRTSHIEEPLAKFTEGIFLVDEDGTLHAEGVENVIMLIPMIPLFVLSGITHSMKIWQAFAMSFCSSAFIEVIQLIFHIGYTQVSDILFNTLGGMIGWCIYFVVHRIYKSLV